MDLAYPPRTRDPFLSQLSRRAPAPGALGAGAREAGSLWRRETTLQGCHAGARLDLT
jgi:hypothetical protein